MGRDARLETAVDDLTAAVVLSTAEVAPLQLAIENVDAAVDLATAQIALVVAALNSGVDFTWSAAGEAANMIALTITCSDLAQHDLDYQVCTADGQPVESDAWTVAVGASGTLLTTTAKAAGRVRTTTGGVAILNLTDVSGASTALMGVRIKAADAFRTLTAQFA